MVPPDTAAAVLIHLLFVYAKGLCFTTYTCSRSRGHGLSWSVTQGTNRGSCRALYTSTAKTDSVKSI